MRVYVACYEVHGAEHGVLGVYSSDALARSELLRCKPLYDHEVQECDTDDTDEPIDDAPPDPDELALHARRATGCLYRRGTCLCPAPPFVYPGCLAKYSESKNS